MEDVKHFRAGQQLLAILVPSSFSRPGIHFFTPDNLSQQMAYIGRSPGYEIAAHKHQLHPREIAYTSEALFIRTGRIRVDLYDNDQIYVTSLVASAGDVILLVSGGHGFEIIEACEMIEIKQGPYAGDCDKVRFPSIKRDRLVVSYPEP